MGGVGGERGGMEDMTYGREMDEEEIESFI
jgi:hypothetical protein